MVGTKDESVRQLPDALKDKKISLIFKKVGNIYCYDYNIVIKKYFGGKMKRALIIILLMLSLTLFASQRYVVGEVFTIDNGC